MPASIELDMPCKHKKHTPIKSRKQQKLFGAELTRKKKGKKGRTKMSVAILHKHLKESKGKKLPKKVKKRKWSVQLVSKRYPNLRLLMFGGAPNVNVTIITHIVPVILGLRAPILPR